MGEPSADRVELVVRTMAQTAVDNEKYFGDLDAVDKRLDRMSHTA